MAKTEPESGAELVPAEAPGPMVMAIVGDGPIPIADTERAQRRIVDAILAAGSPEELITAGQAVSAADILGVPIEVHDCELLPSTMGGEGPGVFMVLDCVALDTGEAFVFTTSAQNVMLRVGMAKDRGWLPLRFKIEKADRETARGFTPYVVKAI